VLYERLERLTGSPVVALNRAVAIAEAGAPERALELVQVGSERLSYGRGGYAVAFAERLSLDAVAVIEKPPSGLPRAVRILCEVETAGIEPASAVARKVASTSVAGSLISPSTRLAGGVVGGQLRRCPPRGWSRPHRVSPLFEPDRHRGRMTAG